MSDDEKQGQDAQQGQNAPQNHPPREQDRVPLIPRDALRRAFAKFDSEPPTFVPRKGDTPRRSITLFRENVDIEPAATESRMIPQPDAPPWTLQQFFEGEIDLDVELSKRYPSLPMMSRLKFRTVGARSRRRVATLTTQDEAAQLVIDADVETKVIQLAFTMGSMLTLRFTIQGLSDIDRTRWLDLMRRDEGGLAFLWGPARWEKDYAICITRQYQTSIFAFSPNQFDAGIRMTASATESVIDWLTTLWDDDTPDEDSQQILTW